MMPQRSQALYKLQPDRNVGNKNFGIKPEQCQLGFDPTGTQSYWRMDDCHRVRDYSGEQSQMRKDRPERRQPSP